MLYYYVSYLWCVVVHTLIFVTTKEGDNFMSLYQHQIDVLQQTKQKNKVAYYLDMG